MKTMLSERVLNINPSMTLVISAKAKEMKASGTPVLDFSAGEPDFDTPQAIKQAAVRAMEAGFTKYTATGGIAELKEAIIAKYKDELNLAYTPDEIIVSNGGKHALHNLMQVLLNPGDECIIPSPYWLSYPEMTKLSGGKPVIVSTRLEDDYKLRIESLRQAITPKSKILILNSPSNPTGAVYTAKELEAIIAVLQDTGILVISDDVYEKFVFDGRPFANVLSVAPRLKDRVLIVNSASKTYSMPGWRMGFAVGPAEVIKAAARVQGQATSSPNSISQKAYAFALRGDPAVVEEFRKSFETRRNLIYEGMSAIKGVRAFKPQGAFYLFVDVSELYPRVPGVKGSVDFCKYLLEKLQIACIPGAPFGEDRCIRFSFVTDEASIREAVARFKKI
jgi:aspartate aminotransferase